MKKLINSEYSFSMNHNKDLTIRLTVYIDYEAQTYDIVQNHQEGIFCRNNNKDTHINKKYMLLAIEALDFNQQELFESKLNKSFKGLFWDEKLSEITGNDIDTESLVSIDMDLVIVFNECDGKTTVEIQNGTRYRVDISYNDFKKLINKSEQ